MTETTTHFVQAIHLRVEPDCDPFESFENDNGSGADAFFASSEGEMLEYLLQWEHNDGGEPVDPMARIRPGDRVYRAHNYLMFYNPDDVFEYASLYIEFEGALEAPIDIGSRARELLANLEPGSHEYRRLQRTLADFEGALSDPASHAFDRARHYLNRCVDDIAGDMDAE